MFLDISGSLASPTLIPILFLFILLLIILGLNSSPTMLTPIEFNYMKFFMIFDRFPLIPHKTTPPYL
jgi:hypothetical protein